MLVDQLDREQAVDPTGSFIVQAPAGSGKTGLLVRRILTLLGVVERPEEILAITFTRKATAEMRERVLEALETAKTGGTFKSYEQDLADYARRALERDREMQWHLLQQPRRLRIQTIDSLCAELVRKMPWSTRFGGAPQVENDLGSLYAQAAQNLLEKIDQDSLTSELSALLFYANGDLQNLQQQLANMLHSRESWLELIFTHQALDSREALEQSWLELAEEAIARLESICGPAFAAELTGLMQYAQDKLLASEHEVDDAHHAALKEASPRDDPALRLLRWKLVAKMLCTDKGAIRTRITRANGFPNKDACKQRVEEILAEIADNEELRDALQAVGQIPHPEISDTEWDRLCALNTVLPALAQELYVIMVERNCADYDELARRAIDALGTPEQPSDLALVQDYRIRHILMDEFQDTSPTQLQLLRQLVAGWQGNEPGRSLFLVGDPMQSIYGFRKADVRVFLNVREEGIGDIRLQALELKVNFRSSPDIIDWVNRIMPTVFPARDDPARMRVSYTACEASKDTRGRVYTHLCVAEAHQRSEEYRYAEAQQIILIIRKLRSRYPHQSIAVLARKRTPLTALAECLREAVIPFEAVELEKLDQQSIIQDLISLSGVLLQPMDTLAWLAVLRAPWCGLCLNDLTLLREDGRDIYDILCSTDFPEGLSHEGFESLSRLSAHLVPLVRMRERLEISERVRRAWLRLRGPVCYDAHELVHVEPYFEMLNTLESGPLPVNRARLLEACAEHSSSSPAGTLKLMTFHKAKGLEFDHVILTGLAARSGGDHRQSPLLFSVERDGKFLLAPSSLAGDSAPSKAAFIRQYQKSIEAEESARLLYVAVTRAQRQLYLFATLKLSNNGTLGKPDADSLLSLAWESLESDFSQAQNQSTVTSNDPPDETSSTIYKGVALEALPPVLAPLKLPGAIQFTADSHPPPEEVIEFSWAKEDARVIGLVVHRMLEFADLARISSWKHDVDLKAIASALGHNGLPSARIEKAVQRTVDILGKLAGDHRARWLFDPGHRDTRTEWALSSIQAGEIRNQIIDRSFIDAEGVRWIVDFKTGAHEGSDLQHFLDEEEKRYAEQLDGYAQLVQALEPGRMIRLGLYFPAHGEWREREFRG